MTQEQQETYSTEGPQCPYCRRQYTADDPVYFDEMGYTRETCDVCSKTFKVSVFTQTSWTCEPCEEVSP
jgi:ribosomal protein L37AE/L43A